MTRTWKDAMAFIPIPNAIRASIEATFGGQIVVLTLGWEKAGAVVEEDLSDLNDALESWVGTELAPYLSDDVMFTGVTSTDQTSESAPSVYKPFSPTIPGQSNSTPTPQNVAIACGFKTNLRGRSYRGRNYIFGIPATGFTTPGNVDPAFGAQLLAAYTALADVTTATNLVHSVLSTQHNGSPRVTGVATPVTAYQMDLKGDSQRRRLPGRGA